MALSTDEFCLCRSDCYSLIGMDEPGSNAFPAQRVVLSNKSISAKLRYYSRRHYY